MMIFGLARILVSGGRAIIRANRNNRRQLKAMIMPLSPVPGESVLPPEDFATVKVTGSLSIMFP